MTALLSIKPEFANAIFDGSKRFEFRRNIFKRNVTRVVIYVTAPVSMVMGEFSVDGILHDDVNRLWSQTQQHAGISQNRFMDYFEDKSKGYAIKIGKVQKYDEPLSLMDDFGKQPPQSFLYL